jgi:hypothetical protein
MPAPPAPGSSTGVSFVVADPNAVTIVSKVTPQSTSGTLTRGVALALGPIHTATVVQNIAAVVGYGNSPTCSSCSVLAIIDMTNPAQPQALSFTALTSPAVSVVLNGNTVIIGYNIDASDLYDLTTSNPIYVTLAPPLQYTDASYLSPVQYPPSATTVYHTTLNLALTSSESTDQTSAFWNTWNQFTTGGGPANIQTWQGRKLYYYRNDPSGVPSVTIIGFEACALDG